MTKLKKRKYWIFFWLLPILFCSHISSFAQNTPPVATGIINSSNGQPIANTIVKALKGKNEIAAVTSDSSGKFVFETLPEGNISFSFSSDGYTSQTLTGYNIVKTETINILVELERVANNLDEVVVIGYGAAKRSDLTGSIASLSSKAYKDQPITTLSSALQGRVPGVVVTSVSGSPGGDVKIRIRGANSATAGNDPLYVIAGVALGTLAFNQLNVNDIQSFDILKDASATAIYGNRGANGVIIITTKRGKNADPRVSYDGFVTINNPIKKYELLDPVSYAKIANLTAGSNVFSNPDSLAGKGTNWQDKIFNNNSITQNHQLSLNGGSPKIRYYISGFYINEEGTLINTKQQRFGLRANLDIDISKKINFKLFSFIERTKSYNLGDNGTKGNPVMAALTWAPTNPVYTDQSNGIYLKQSLIGGQTAYNPYMTLRERNINTFNTSGIISGVLSYTFNDWLKFSSTSGLDFSNPRTAYFNNQWIGNVTGSGQGYTEAFTFQNNNALTFHKLFVEKHDFTVTIAEESVSSTASNFNATGTSLSNLNNGYYNLGLNANTGINSGYIHSSQLSFLGRAIYSYDNKYLITASIRRDGSSKFPDQKWGNFPSFGLGWNVMNESFMKGFTTISNLKIEVDGVRLVMIKYQHIVH